MRQADGCARPSIGSQPGRFASRLRDQARQAIRRRSPHFLPVRRLIDSSDNSGFRFRTPLYPGEKPPWGRGSSFPGYIVTNNHVVANSTSLEVTTDDGKIYQAKLIGADTQTDVAVIKVTGGQRFSLCAICCSRATHRRLGSSGRQSIWARWYGHGWDRFGARPRHWRRPV